MATSAAFDRLLLYAPHLTSRHFIPVLIYGTAWKKDATSDLVYQALCNGFTGIDTANQPRHYREELVGVGLNKAIAEGKVSRHEIYLQTKFTPLSEQDPKQLPYDPASPLTEQVRASVESSLQHFTRESISEEDIIAQETYIDALVLHSPLPSIDQTMEAWRTLEGYVPDKIRNLGVSNCNLFTLMDIYDRAKVKPAVVQNRFHYVTKFDIGLRRFCRQKGIIYQSFWTLTANPELLQSEEIINLSHQIRVSPQAALYCLVLGLGNTVILDGTKNIDHMKEDVAATHRIRDFVVEHGSRWEDLRSRFRKRIGESEA